MTMIVFFNVLHVYPRRIDKRPNFTLETDLEEGNRDGSQHSDERKGRCLGSG